MAARSSNDGAATSIRSRFEDEYQIELGKLIKSKSKGTGIPETEEPIRRFGGCRTCLGLRPR